MKKILLMIIALIGLAYLMITEKDPNERDDEWYESWRTGNR